MTVKKILPFQPKLPFDTDRDPGDESDSPSMFEHFKPLAEQIKRELDELDDDDDKP
jgi:hypothetical protein